MHERRVIGISGWSGTGKTLVIEGLVRVFKARGVRVACIKHAAHGVDLDRQGTDSARMAAAGPDAVVVCAPDVTATFEAPCGSLADALTRVPDVDIVLVEGFNDAVIPRVEVVHEGRPLRAPRQSLVASVSETARGGGPAPCFSRTEMESLADLLLPAARERRSHPLAVRNNARSA